jgi:hypothetical protein
LVLVLLHSLRNNYNVLSTSQVHTKQINTMPKAFAHFTIAISGDFGKERTLEDLKRWISKNGGNYSKNVDQNVTHLVCSKEHYKKESQAVKKAKPIKTCSIVTYDWLEDCCQNKRRRPCGKYLCKTVFKETIKEKAERRNREKTALKKDGEFSLTDRLFALQEMGSNFSVRLFNEGCSMAMADFYSGT